MNQTLRIERTTMGRRAWLAIMLLLAAAFAAASFFFVGCTTISGEAVSELETNGAAVDGNLKDWDKLTDAQKKTAHTGAGRAFYDVLNAVKGTPIPPAYQVTKLDPSPTPSPSPSPVPSGSGGK